MEIHTCLFSLVDDQKLCYMLDTCNVCSGMSGGGPLESRFDSVDV